MRFLVDECTGPAVAEWLRAEGHDVVSVYDDRRGIDDDAVLQIAISERRILITNDKDFGDKVFRDGRRHHGVVLMRLDDERSAVKVATVRRLIAQYAEELPDRFTVVTENRVRLGAKADVR
ncbi:MAG TPA: DUF5615 family PIN-like protein [Chthonomonadaceae bacterium]|nr:DUF5615 family PIN-like protein [Chthonomonadaceae bacterium]